MLRKRGKMDLNKKYSAKQMTIQTSKWMGGDESGWFGMEISAIGKYHKKHAFGHMGYVVITPVHLQVCNNTLLATIPESNMMFLHCLLYDVFQWALFII